MLNIHTTKNTYAHQGCGLGSYFWVHYLAQGHIDVLLLFRIKPIPFISLMEQLPLRSSCPHSGILKPHAETEIFKNNKRLSAFNRVNNGSYKFISSWLTMNALSVECW